MQVWNVPCVDHWKCRTQKWRKNRHLCTIAQICWAVSSQLRHISTIGKNLFSSHTSSTCPHNMVNFGPLMAGIGLGVLGTCKFQRVSRIAALLHVTQVVSQTLWCWTEGATYIRQGSHHVRHWPTFLLAYVVHSFSHYVNVYMEA